MAVKTKKKGTTRTRVPGIRISKSGKYFIRARVRMPDGITKQIQRTYESMTEAILALNDFKSKKEIELYDNNIKFEDLVERYLEYKSKEGAKPSTVYSLRKVFTKHILPYFKGTAINAITVRDIGKWKHKLNALDLSDNYKRKAFINFKAMFQYAVIYFKLKENPFDYISNFKTNKKTIYKYDFYTHKEFIQFDGAAYNESPLRCFKTFFEFLYYTGCRKGEAQALKWSDIDWEKETVKITKTLLDISYKELENKQLKRPATWEDKIDAPKNLTSNREIDISGFLIEQLRKLYEQLKSMDGFNDDCLVFGVHEPLPNSAIYNMMGVFAERAGLRRIKVHELRHSHASLLVELGFGIFEIANRLGHSSITVTEKRYSHLYPDVQKKMALKVTQDRQKIAQNT